MAITDHINMTGVNLLVGPNDDAIGPRFPPCATRMTRRCWLRFGPRRPSSASRSPRAVYLAVGGPSFETPAEIRAFRVLGADAVGMSTVQETIVPATAACASPRCR